VNEAATPAPAVRHKWMFRMAALLFLFFGVVWIWRFGFTDYHPEQRPYGLAFGLIALLVGVFLMRLRRWAIGLSALAAAVVGISAAVFAPNSKGPAILFLAGIALLCVIYAALALRVALAGPRDADPASSSR
jgi:predicted branched-subunit amino acid permease